MTRTTAADAKPVNKNSQVRQKIENWDKSHIFKIGGWAGIGKPAAHRKPNYRSHATIQRPFRSAAVFSHGRALPPRSAAPAVIQWFTK
jgi:hypothetical protein